MQDDYFKTGDLAKYDCEGWVYVEGRVDDLVMVKEIRMSPREIEEATLAHPYVRDVAVIGNDQKMLACVLVKPDAKLDETNLMT